MSGQFPGVDLSTYNYLSLQMWNNPQLTPKIVQEIISLPKIPLAHLSTISATLFKQANQPHQALGCYCVALYLLMQMVVPTEMDTDGEISLEACAVELSNQRLRVAGEVEGLAAEINGVAKHWVNHITTAIVNGESARTVQEQLENILDQIRGLQPIQKLNDTTVESLMQGLTI